MNPCAVFWSTFWVLFLPAVMSVDVCEYFPHNSKYLVGTAPFCGGHCSDCNGADMCTNSNVGANCWTGQKAECQPCASASDVLNLPQSGKFILSRFLDWAHVFFLMTPLARSFPHMFRVHGPYMTWFLRSRLGNRTALVAQEFTRKVPSEPMAL